MSNLQREQILREFSPRNLRNGRNALANILFATVLYGVLTRLMPLAEYPPMLNPKLKLNRVVDASGIKMSQRNADGFNEWQQYIRQSVG